MSAENVDANLARFAAYANAWKRTAAGGGVPAIKAAYVAGRIDLATFEEWIELELRVEQRRFARLAGADSD